MDATLISGILVFKTSIGSENDLEKIATVLDRELRIHKWNVDREDIDRVLRIESAEPDPSYFIRLVTREGFYCEELPD